MASKEVGFQSGKPKRTGCAGRWDNARTFLYNSEDGTVLGRTCRSWAKLGVFYSIYYTCLAAFFAICIVVFFQTLDDVEPRLQGMHSLLKGNPGMGFRPMPRLQSTLIRFQIDDEDSYKKYVDHIEEYVSKYKAEKYMDATGICGADGANKEAVLADGKSCRFDLQTVLKDSGCTLEDDYGYKTGTPCVLLKLNKIFGWDPDTFDNETILEDTKHAEAARAALGNNFDPNYIGMTCEGENPGDIDHRGEIEFFPRLGIPTMFFPFMNTPGYLPPFVFAKFNNPREGTLVQLWCKAWTRNIYHHRNDKAGSIHLELLVDN